MTINHQIPLIFSNQTLQMKIEAIQPANIVQYNTTTTSMDTSTSTTYINQSRSNQQFSTALTSITDYKNNLLMTFHRVK